MSVLLWPSTVRETYDPPSDGGDVIVRAPTGSMPHLSLLMIAVRKFPMTRVPMPRTKDGVRSSRDIKRKSITMSIEIRADPADPPRASRRSWWREHAHGCTTDAFTGQQRQYLMHSTKAKLQYGAASERLRAHGEGIKKNGSSPAYLPDVVDTCGQSAARLGRRERQVRVECIRDFNKKLCGPRWENIGQAKVGALFVGQKSRFGEVFSRPSTSYCNSYIIRLILPDGPSSKWTLAKATPVQIPQSLTLIWPWHERLFWL